MKGQSPSNIDWEKEKTTLNKMIQHAVIGDYSKKAAELVFKAEYGNTPEEQAKAIQANLGRFPSQIQKEDYAFIDQNFVRASNMIQSPNLETFTELNLFDFKLHRLPVALSTLKNLTRLLINRNCLKTLPE